MEMRIPLIDEIMKEEIQKEPTDTPPGIPSDVLNLDKGVGWHRDVYGNPVQVTKKTWAYRTPAPYWDSNTLPYRTTWAAVGSGWVCLENEVCWASLSDPHGMIPDGPVKMLVTIFLGRTRKQICEDSVPWSIRKKLKGDESKASHQIMEVSLNKLKKMMDKEIPYDMIPPEQMPMFQAAIQKEWQSWLDYQSCEVLSLEESHEVEKTHPKRILPSRFVLRDKHSGLLGIDGTPLPVKPKARLCLAGHLCPDAATGQVQVDSPTVERISTMMFLNMVISFGWLKHWYIGDISNAFLQGAPLKGEVMFMRQPKQGLPGLEKGQLLRLVKAVYGRPDAPRQWFNELSRILVEEMKFTQSLVDPALFFLRNDRGGLMGMLTVHVDDISHGWFPQSG